MNKQLQQRIAALEQRSQVGAGVVGVRYINAEDWEGKDPNMVKIAGTDEEMTVTEWHQRYPAGQLIEVEYVEEWGRDGF